MSGDATGLERPETDVTVTVNGEELEATVEPRLKLSDFLRQVAQTRGVRVGCEHGACGACSVLLDGELVKSCLLYAVQADGSEVETVEGLALGGELHPIQQAFDDRNALQCGFCTSGFVMATKALLADEPDPDREAIQEGLAGNICRCSGYAPIYEAVHQAADEVGGAVTDGGREDV
jgi:carbon-monoxide dehydrogenase small subunit